MKRATFPAKLLICAIFSFVTTFLHAADYYWVGGSGNWSDYSHHWATTSGGNTFQTRIPLSIDNVFFDEASFTGTGQTVTVDIATAQALSMSWTGVKNAPTFTGAADKTLKLFGSLTFVPGMTSNFAGVVYFAATTKGQTITSAGQAFQNEIYFQGAGGEWTLQDDFTVLQGVPVADIRCYAGKLYTNNNTVTTPRFFSYDYGSPRLVNFSSSTVVITDGNWEVINSSPGDFTIDADSATLVFPNGGLFTGGNGNIYHNLRFGKSDGTGAGTIRGDNTIFNGLISFYSSGSASGNYNHYNGDLVFYHSAYFVTDIYNYFAGTVTLLGNGSFTGSQRFNNLLFSPGFTYTIQSGTTQTIIGQLSANGTGAKPITIQASNSGQVATIAKSSGNICLDYVWMSDIDGYGGGVFNAGKSPERSIDLGNNPGWIFTGGCSSIVLPVTLSSFTATCIQNGGVQVKWHTQTEKNLSYFSIEKSSDGLSFNTVTTAKARGSNANDYSFVDNNTGLGKTFYRLKQTDNDGQPTYSSTITTACNEVGNKVKIYPNPNKGLFTIAVPTGFSEMRLAVYNVVGNKLYENSWRNNKAVDINLSSLPKGIYYLSLFIDNEEKKERMVIQ